MAEDVTARLGLVSPTPGTSEPVDLADHLGSNWAKIDQAIGAFPCTSGMRPSSPFDGMFIRETDTGFLYVRNGTSSTWLQVLTGTTVFLTSIGVDVQEFTANGTWTKPANAQRVFVRGVAGGKRNLCSGDRCACVGAQDKTFNHRFRVRRWCLQ